MDTVDAPTGVEAKKGFSNVSSAKNNFPQDRRRARRVPIRDASRASRHPGRPSENLQFRIFAGRKKILATSGDARAARPLPGLWTPGVLDFGLRNFRRAKIGAGRIFGGRAIGRAERRSHHPGRPAAPDLLALPRVRPVAVGFAGWGSAGAGRAAARRAASGALRRELATARDARRDAGAGRARREGTGS